MSVEQFQSTPRAVMIIGEAAGGPAVSFQPQLSYRVSTFREAGLEARWGRTSEGRPVIFARKPGGRVWWLVTAGCWARAKVVGLFQAFDESTFLGDIFSVPVGK